jgi:hypothetical protein
MTGKKGSQALPFFCGLVNVNHMGYNLTEMFHQAKSDRRAAVHD